MRSNMEREAFARRLKAGLVATGDDGASPTRLAREFNRRYPGPPISLHAARKWLLGDALPVQDKLRVLAAWLGTTAEWLRFGAGPGRGRQPIVGAGGMAATGANEAPDSVMIPP